MKIVVLLLVMFSAFINADKVVENGSISYCNASISRNQMYYTCIDKKLFLVIQKSSTRGGLGVTLEGSKCYCRNDKLIKIDK